MNNDGHAAEAYHSQTDRKVMQIFGTHPEHGLSEDEAKDRLATYGPNKLREDAPPDVWKVVLNQFKSIVIIVLVIAGTVAFAFGHMAEGIAILAVLLINAAIGFFTEWKAIGSMRALRALSNDTIRVRRDGEDREIDSDNLVPGDLVFVEEGDLVPSDMRLAEANRISVDESALTGESVPVRKSTDPVDANASLADRTCMAYKGTTVTDGSGEGIVTGTGMNTELGRISDLAQHAEKEATPLQKRLDQLGRRLAWITLSLAALIATAGLLAGRETFHMLEIAIALGVAAIPEGLPIVSTIALARGMQLMARRNVLINKLPAVETLGATQVIFADKTGTLTENRMTLRQLSTQAGDTEIDGNPENGTGREDSLSNRIIEVGVLCNNASLRDADNDLVFEEEVGDPTETALLRAGVAFGFDRKTLLEAKPEIREIPFDADKMMMATYHRTDRGTEVAVKGAPKRVLEVCDRIADDGGNGGRPLSAGRRKKWEDKAESMAGQGYRVLAVADKLAESGEEEPYRDLRFLGIMGLLDPPREDVEDAIRECRKAGIRVVMVTGDKAATAAAIGSQTGISDEDRKSARVIRGKELKNPDELTDDFIRNMRETAIFSRVSPEQKMRLIKLFQDDGLTVAMTGDGVNDAPALKKADIGIGMGRRGTDAAIEAADMVLRDDAFSSIVAAVRQGRIIFDNIRKSVMFMLCTNVAEVIAVAIAAMLGGFSNLPIPLLPLQILYLNVITDVFPALALGMGEGSEDVMERKPRPKQEPVLTRSHWGAIAGWAVLMAACVLGSLAIAFYGFDFGRHQAVTVSFLTLAFAKLWFVFNLRNPGTRIFDNDIVKNPYILFSIALCAVLLILGIYLPGLSDVLKTRNPGLAGWALLLGMSFVPFAVGQALRMRK